MHETDRGAALVRAAQAGDQRALDQLVSAWLPLVYNIVGRALQGHADVDDVVQETMLRAVRSLGDLREPEKFRSWLVAITMRQIRAHWNARRAGVIRIRPQDAVDIADPGADFVDLTITRLGLLGQRREVAEATRWLDPDDAHLLSLWWLEAAGELTRTELANALDLTSQHATVRVQRMKAQLDAARTVVRALGVFPRCPELAAVLRGWTGQPSTLWRKRLARHCRECVRCSQHWAELVPADRLLVGLSLVPLPVGFALPALIGGTGGPAGGKISGWLGKVTQAFAAKPVAAAATATVVLAGGATAAYGVGVWPSPSTRATTTLATPPVIPIAVPTSTRAPTPHPSPTLSPPTSPAGSPDTSAEPATTKPSASPTGPAYGSNVDTADEAPADKLRPPGALPKRPTGPEVIAIGGRFQDRQPGWIGGRYVMMYRGDHVTLKGRGYLQVRYEIGWFNRPGSMVMPTWTGLKGRLFHVASGGLRRMDDAKPGLDSAYTWMGEPGRGYVVLPRGAQQMWQNEFFYLDGEVILTNHERGADYNITATPKTWDEVVKDITTPKPADPVKAGWVRYGIVRDTGNDGAPVPQYCTREVTSDPARVPQRSTVS